MSAIPDAPEDQACDAPILVPVTVDLLDELLPIEQASYTHPWTRGNFIDALANGYHAMAVLATSQGPLMGYFVAMRGVDEVHLLNITVAPAFQHRGCAHLLLETLSLWVRGLRLPWLWLEVRESNARARMIYERFGFRTVGRRKGYYPLLDGGHEDAILMTLQVC